VNEGTVTFTVLNGTTQVGSPVVSGTVTNGSAGATYTLPAATGAGTYTIAASYKAGADFTASSGSGMLTIDRAPQTITFGNPGAETFGTTPTLSASASSALPVSFTSATASVCTVTTDGTLAFAAAGTCTIDADQAGNGDWDAAAEVSQSFSVTSAGGGGGGGSTPAAPASTTTTTTSTAPTPSSPVVAAVPATGPPAAPADFRGRFGTKGTFVLSWKTPPAGVSSYELDRNGSPSEHVAGTSTEIIIRALARGKRIVYTLFALAATGSPSAGSAAVTLDPVERPAQAPRRIPAWAWSLLRWQERGRTGSRPSTPASLPRWYSGWEAWRLTPFKLLNA
jgi:hypothetical protein